MHAQLKKDDASLQKKSSNRHQERSSNVDQNSDLPSEETTEGFDSSPGHALQPTGQGQLVMQCKGLSDSPEPTCKSDQLIQRRENKTGLPDTLKNGIENLSGYPMDDVTVHYNSHRPAQLRAHAYTQGTAIHVAPGQEQHLPHEAWHVVQQKQGRVTPTLQMKGKVNVNDDAGLEREADVMGCRAASVQYRPAPDAISRFIGSATEGQAALTHKTPSAASDASAPIQRKIDFLSLARIPAEEKGGQGVGTPRLMAAFFRVWSLAKELKIDLVNKFMKLHNTSLEFELIKREPNWRGRTLLYCKDNDGIECEYDHREKDFNELARGRKINSFRVLIKINEAYVHDDWEKKRTVGTGNLMQIIAHEMLVHAENMANYIQEYWDYRNDERTKPPKKLPDTVVEHGAFSNEIVMNYEKLLKEVKRREKIFKNPETAFGKMEFNIYRDFIAGHEIDFNHLHSEAKAKDALLPEETRLGVIKLLEANPEHNLFSEYLEEELNKL